MNFQAVLFLNVHVNDLRRRRNEERNEANEEKKEIGVIYTLYAAV